MTSLKIDLKVGESVTLGGLAVITLMDKSGKLARLDIKADEAVKIRHIKTEASQLARGGITVPA